MLGADGSELNDDLYVDSARRRVWGDGVSAGTQAIRGESDGRRPSIIPVFGTVPLRQSVLTVTARVVENARAIAAGSWSSWRAG